MSYFTDFIEGLIEDRIQDIKQSMTCKIDSFNSAKMRADVIPQMQFENESGSTDYPILTDLPVKYLKSGNFYIKPEYKKDDLVLIVFSTFAIREALENKIRPESQEMFNLGNAYVLGGIAADDHTDPTNISGKTGLLIGNDKVFIQIENEKILIENVTGSSFTIDGDDIEIKNNSGSKIVHNGVNIEINGNTKNFVTHAELNTALQTFITALNAHVHAVTAVGSPTGPPVPLQSIDISASKTNTVKTG